MEKVINKMNLSLVKTEAPDSKSSFANKYKPWEAAT